MSENGGKQEEVELGLFFTAGEKEETGGGW